MALPFFQDSPGVTLSGSAVIKVDYLKLNFITIADMPVPECDHSSFRAEVFSIFLTLSCIYQPIIYSYCQTVVTHLQTLLECHQGYPPYSIGSGIFGVEFGSRFVADHPIPLRFIRQKHIVNLTHCWVKLKNGRPFVIIMSIRLLKKQFDPGNPFLNWCPRLVPWIITTAFSSISCKKFWLSKVSMWLPISPNPNLWLYQFLTACPKHSSSSRQDRKSVV